MRGLVVALLPLLLHLPVWSAPGPKSEPAPKPEKVKDWLQGEWVAVETEEKGKLCVGKGDLVQLVISKDQLRIVHDGDNEADGSFALSVRKDGLYDLDVCIEEGATNHALMQVHDNETFTIVVHSRFQPNKPGDRPTAITSETDKEKDPCGLWNPLLFKFKRVPKGQKPGEVIEAYQKSKKK